MNYFKAAEQILSAVPVMERALDNLEKRKVRIMMTNKPAEVGAIDPSKSYVNSGQVRDTLAEMLELSECVGNIAKTSAKLAEINAVLEQLPEDKARVLRAWYIDHLSKEKIADMMGYESITSVYNIRNMAVAEFALSYFGAAALDSV